MLGTYLKVVMNLWGTKNEGKIIIWKPRGRSEAKTVRPLHKNDVFNFKWDFIWRRLKLEEWTVDL